MASIFSSSPNTSLWPSESNSTTLRDVSFSSYLNSSEEDYIRSLPPSAQNLRKKAEDGEIDIFGAEKYFNQGIIDRHTNSKQYNMKNQTRDIKLQQQPRTPSCQSSESSWNSQSALLRRLQRPPSRGTVSTVNSNSNNNIKSQGRKLFLLPCYCCDRNSIVIDEQPQPQVENKNVNSIRLHTDPSFVFPVPEVVNKVTVANVEKEEEGRKSIEVFGSNELKVDEIGSKSFSLEKRLNMLSWDSIPKPIEDDNLSSVGAPSESYRDSDASSDLFELDCLSCKSNPIGLGLTPPPPCYAPSEASIEWSVVTASAADFSEDQKSTAPPHKRVPHKSKPRATTLLGCKSQKAVRVAGEVHKALPANRQAVNNNSTIDSEKKALIVKKKYMTETELGGISMSRFQAEAKVQQIRNEPSPRWSHSSHASDLLYIH